MKTEKLISIIVPVYNVEKYLEQCLDSILNQTYKNLEIILVDDGSTDNSGSICDRYGEKDSRIKVIHQKNGGVCAARNTALKAVTGDYIGFVDPDDWCAEDMFEYLCTKLEETDSDVSVCRYYRIIEGKTTTSRCDGIDRVLTKDEAIEELVNHFIIRHIFWNKLFKRELFEDFLFPEGRIYEGRMTVHQLLLKCEKVILCGSPKYYYRKNDESYIYKVDLKSMLDFVIACITIYNNLADKYEHLQKKMMRDFCDTIARLADERIELSEEILEANREDIEVIQNFIEENHKFIYRKLLRIYPRRKQMNLICEFTVESLQKAQLLRKQNDYSKELHDYGTISVIVPVYKVEKHLRKCIKSLLNQTYTKLEIILVDDGSPDKCGEICEYYASRDRRIKVIHKENGGLCSARNAGLKEATGDYIGFVDSDDYCSPDMYEYLIKGIKMYNAQVASCRYYRAIPNKPITARADGMDVFYEDHDSMMTDFIEEFVIRSTFWNKLFERSLFDGKQFPEGRTFEGTYFMHEVLENVDRLVSLGEAKYYYLDNEDSIVNTRSLNNVTDYITSYIKRFYDLKDEYPKLKNKLFDDTVKAILSMTYVGYRSSEKEIKARKESFEEIKAFLDENSSLVKQLSKTVQKELAYLSAGTHKSFKKAKLLKSVMNRLSKLSETVFGRKIKFKKTTAVKKNTNYRQAPEMTPENQAKLRQLQLTITELIDEIDRICKKHNLRYYLYGGTLLGAVRHKGFIPWDDDADLVMPRADYEKFREICKTELGKEFFYQTSQTDEDFHMLFTKIRKNNTYIHEDKWESKNMHKGIFVDILPLDHFPKNKLMGKIVLHAASMMHQICAFNSCASDSIIAKIIFKIGKKMPKRFNYKVRDILLKTTNKLSSKENICSFGSHYQPMIRRVFKTDWFFGEEITMEFEGRQFRVPTNWEKYILHLFGKNYMELPPMEMRICHTDFTKINFESDKEPGKE